MNELHSFLTDLKTLCNKHNLWLECIEDQLVILATDGTKEYRYRATPKKWATVDTLPPTNITLDDPEVVAYPVFVKSGRKIGPFNRIKK